jgi:hypothetical protein
MRIRKPVIVAAVGQYGPFEDGRTIRYADLLDAEGGGVMRATFAQDAADMELAVTASGDADLELHQSEKGLRLRLHGFAAATAAVRKAA